MKEKMKKDCDIIQKSQEKYQNLVQSITDIN